MTGAEPLARDADVPHALAVMVAEAAHRAGVSIRVFRTYDRRPHLVRERQRLAVEARDRGFSAWQVGRAINRDHSSVLTAERHGRALAKAGRLELLSESEIPLPVQLDFLPGPLFDFAGAVA